MVEDRLLSLDYHRLVQQQRDTDTWERTNVWEYVEPSPFRKVMWALGG